MNISDLTKSRLHLSLPGGEEIITDKEMLEVKKKTMRHLRWNSFLTSVADTSKYIAGILTTVAMAISLESFAGAVGGGLAAGLAAVPPLGTALLLAATAVTGVAVVSQYAASRIGQSAIFNNREIAARSTAKHLVQEIESHNMCLAENKGRADGKSWIQYTEDRRALTQPGQSL